MTTSRIMALGSEVPRFRWGVPPAEYSDHFSIIPNQPQVLQIAESTGSVEDRRSHRMILLVFVPRVKRDRSSSLTGLGLT